jgi:dephospho-CoA kinase
MAVIGLTGGIASGKSTVAGMLTAEGAEIIDADLLARQAVQPGRAAYKAVVAAFGSQVVAKGGQLDRQRLGALVFADDARRKQLEGLIHPFVREETENKRLEIARRRPGALIVLDVPLLFESEMDRGLTEIVVVYVPRDLQLERLMKRDRLSEGEARRRIAAQLDLEIKRRRATRVIDNSGSRAETQCQVEALYRDLLGEDSG